MAAKEPDIVDRDGAQVAWFAPGTRDGAVWADISNGGQVFVNTWHPVSTLTREQARELHARIGDALAYLDARL